MAEWEHQQYVARTDVGAEVDNRQEDFAPRSPVGRIGSGEGVVLVKHAGSFGWL